MSLTSLYTHQVLPRFAAAAESLSSFASISLVEPWTRLQSNFSGFSNLTEEQVADFGMNFALPIFMLLMLWIIWDLARRSKAGKTGTLALFLVLSLGMIGFAAKSVIQIVMKI